MQPALILLVFSNFVNGHLILGALRMCGLVCLVAWVFMEQRIDGQGIQHEEDEEYQEQYDTEPHDVILWYVNAVRVTP